MAADPGLPCASMGSQAAIFDVMPRGQNKKSMALRCQTFTGIASILHKHKFLTASISTHRRGSLARSEIALQKKWPCKRRIYAALYQ
ncbi:MAG: hypothetical protein V4634_07650 [Pseudomonadota bacterium]